MKHNGKKAQQSRRRTREKFATIAKFLNIPRFSPAMVELAEKRLGLVAPRPGEPFCSRRGRTKLVYATLEAQGLIKAQTSPIRVSQKRLVKQSRDLAQVTPDQRTRKLFYDSREWRALRYDVLLKYGRKCMCCGREPPDVQIHVDHIKPLRKYWHLRLTFDNMQILCEDCNLGKASNDETDFRPVKRVRLKIIKGGIA